MRARLAGFALATVLGALAAGASCTGGPTVEEVCTIVCDCFAMGPIEQAQCVAQCPAQIGGLSEPCLQCIVDVEVCSKIENDCEATCGGGGPMP